MTNYRHSNLVRTKSQITWIIIQMVLCRDYSEVTSNSKHRADRKHRKHKKTSRQGFLK